MPGAPPAAGLSGSARAAGLAPADTLGAFSAVLNDAAAAVDNAKLPVDPNDLEAMAAAATDKSAGKARLATNLQLSVALLPIAKRTANAPRSSSTAKPPSDKKPKDGDATQPVLPVAPQPLPPPPPVTVAPLQINTPPPVSDNPDNQDAGLESIRRATGQFTPGDGAISGRNPITSNKAAAAQDALAAAKLDPPEVLPQPAQAATPKDVSTAPIAFELKLKPETTAQHPAVAASPAPETEPAAPRSADSQRPRAAVEPRELPPPVIPARPMEALPPRPAARNTGPAPAVTSVTAASKPADPNS